MEKKTALSAAGALAMTSAAAVSALFLTIGQSSAGADPAPAPAPEVVTEYQVMQVDELDAAIVEPTNTAPVTTEAPTTLPPRTVYEIEYVQEAPAPVAPAYAEYDDDEYEEHEEEHEEEEDEYEEEEDDDEDDDDD